MQPNPFCTRFVRPGAIPFRFENETDASDALAALVDQIAGCTSSLIVGPHGTGKTTLLESLLPILQMRFQQIGRVQLHAPPSTGIGSTGIPLTGILARLYHRRQNARRVAQQQQGIAAGGLLIVDGLEQLSLLARTALIHRVCQRGHRILATSHKNLSRMTTVHETAVDADIVDQIATTLLAESPTELQSIIRNEICLRKLSTVVNVRDLWFELYDVVANVQNPKCRRPLPGDLTAEK